MKRNRRFPCFMGFLSILLFLTPCPAQHAEHDHEETELDSDSRLTMAVVIDAIFHHDGSENGLSGILSSLPGFSLHPASMDSESHDEGFHNGFNLRHIELWLSARVDRYFTAKTTLGIEDGHAMIEEAVIQTTFLPFGLTVSAGKLLSRIGYLNSLHSHFWDFTDRPLIHEMFFGSHGFQDKGLQITWRHPSTPRWTLGAELFNGDNEGSFQRIEDPNLPERKGARLFTGFVKWESRIGSRGFLRCGTSLSSGPHQESEDSDRDGADDVWRDGRSEILGFELACRCESRRGRNWILQGEYFLRRKILSVLRDILYPDLTGRNEKSRQDGYYIQALYEISRHARTGLRWDQIGLTRGSGSACPGASQRLTAMVEAKPSHSSLIRLQTAHGIFRTDSGRKNYWEFSVQLQVLLGKHGCSPST